MPVGRQLRTRLTLWSLMLLILLLGGGGFFCYYIQRQELADSLDSQLLSTSRSFSCSCREVAPAESGQTSFCQAINRCSIRLEGNVAVALYSSQGALLCHSKHPSNPPPELSADILNSSLLGEPFFETTGTQGDRWRQLTTPVIINGQVLYHLRVIHSLASIENRLAKLALLLCSAGLPAVIAFAVVQWVLLGLLTNPLAKLALRMDRTGEGNLSATFKLPFFAGQELQQLVISHNNLTERLSSSLHKARQFSADVTHELRTPLTILRGETELALRGNKDREQLLEILGSNLEEIGRMGDLIEDLLILSKSELGEIPLKMEALDLGTLLQKLHEQAKILAESKHIKLELNGGEEQISLFADGARLRQVFLNLLTNAIKYTPEGGRVIIDWSLQGEAARIIIEDTGIGIDSEHQQHIFDRFYRIEKTRNRNDGGSGLGLAIAKWIVDAHAGSIRVCSMPGQGSKFAVILPLTHQPSHSVDERKKLVARAVNRDA